MMMIPMTAFAEEITLAELDRRQDIVISVIYDTEEPSAVIKSPSGKVYSADTDYTAVERGEYSLYYYIKDAEAGTWTVDCDKKGNQTVTMSVAQWEKEVSVDHFAVTAQEEQTITAEVTVNCEKSRRYNYYLYAISKDQSGNVTGKKLIADGSAYTGSTRSIYASTASLLDGDYTLEFEAAYTTDSGTELSTFYFSDEVFTVSGNTAQATGLVTELDISDETLKLDWSVQQEERVNSWTVEIYTDKPDPDKNTQNYYYAQFDGGQTSDIVILNKELGDVSIKILGELRNGGYVTFEKKVVWDTGVTFNFDTPALTNSAKGVISYDAGGKTLKTVVTINGSSQEFQLTGKSNITLALKEMETNDISVRYSYEENSYYVVSGKISVDSTPPGIDIFGVNDDKLYASSDKITIAGKTENGATLTINGTAQTLGENGSFTADIPLSAGVNTVVIEAADAAGNKISRTLTINRITSDTATEADDKNDTTGGFNIPWVLIATVFGTLFSLLMIWLLSKAANKRLENKGSKMFGFVIKMLAVLRGLFLGLCVTSAGVGAYFVMQYISLKDSISGKNLVNAVQNYTTEQLAEMIAKTDNMKSYFIMFFIISGVLLALFIGSIVGGRLIEKNYSQTHCPNCGKKLNKNASFCDECGAARSGVSGKSVSKPTAPNNQPPAPNNQPTAPNSQPPAPSNQPTAPSNQPPAPSNQPTAPNDQPPSSDDQPPAGDDNGEKKE